MLRGVDRGGTEEIDEGRGETDARFAEDAAVDLSGGGCVGDVVSYTSSDSSLSCGCLTTGGRGGALVAGSPCKGAVYR